MRSRLLKAERIATTSVPPGPHRLDALDRVLPALHRRIRRAARAVYLLLTEDFPYEAVIVARSLFEDWLKWARSGEREQIERGCYWAG